MYVELVYVLNDFRCKTNIKNQIFEIPREKKKKLKIKVTLLIPRFKFAE